jgi:hypothetical protein
MSLKSNACDVCGEDLMPYMERVLRNTPYLIPVRFLPTGTWICGLGCSAARSAPWKARRLRRIAQNL